MVSEATKAVMLLTTHLGSEAPGSPQPLTALEWHRLYQWMTDGNILPEALPESNAAEVFRGFSDKRITVDRLAALLERKAALAIALEKWVKSGVWALTVLDAGYPARLKEKLANAAPPVLFGIGPTSLLNKQYIAIVGSRNTGEDDLKAAYGIGQAICNQGMGIVSGGARGVDEQAMLGCLEAEGNCIGILADSLLRRSSSLQYRAHIQRKDLTLVSPFNPEAGFNVGNAMGRNKLVYALAQAAIVVHSGPKGGTWEGAMENLKKQYVPLWVYPTADQASANAQIVAKGAHWLPNAPDKINLGELEGRGSITDTGLFTDIYPPGKAVTQVGEPEGPKWFTGQTLPEDGGTTDGSIPQAESITLFGLFLVQLKSQFANRQYFTTDEVADQLGLAKQQADAWLKDAVAQEYINLKKRPVRYFWNPFKAEDG